MRKQVFSLIMMLAVIVIASNFASAQGTGIYPNDPYYVSVGSIKQFTITEGATADAADAIAWDVLDVTTAEATAYGGSTSATAGTDYQFVAGLTTATTADPTDATTAYVKFLDEPTNDHYVIEVTTSYSTTSNCSTVRRFYINVFDFEVNAYLCDNTGAVAGGVDADLFTAAVNEGDISQCNSWDANIVQNTITQAQMEGMNADSINNDTDAEFKTTDLYFKIKIQISGASSSLDLDQIKWRFRYSIPNASILDVYEIDQAVTSGAIAFYSNDEDSIAAANDQSEITFASTTAWDANNELYVDELGGAGDDTEEEYVFVLRTHNMAGQDAAMTWDIRIDEVQLETNAANNDYNDGTKVHNAVSGSYDNPVILVDGQSSLTSITQSPATSPISITD